MGLRVVRAEFERYRNLDGRRIEFAPGMTVLVGHNAAGKTNTIEAVQLLTAGRSFRRPTPVQLVAEGADNGCATLREEGDGRVVDLRVSVDRERRTFVRNGKNVRPSTLSGELVSVLFCPDDLAFAKGAPSGRRAEIDDFGRQVNRAYGRLVARYEKAVEQRNRLLREEWCDEALLEAWDESLCIGAAKLLEKRLALFERLRVEWERAYRAIAPGEDVRAEYVSSLEQNICTENVVELFQDKLREVRNEERRRGMTLIGPHRDDLAFYVDGRDVRTFGSQGQQRSVVLAWKMAEVEVVEHIRHEKPLLLLDDVMSELDEGRRAAVSGFVDRGVQMVVSTTNLGYFSAEMLDDAEVVSYDD